MLTPLITAAQAYPVLEKLAEEAQDSLWMSYRIFDPDTRLHSEGARARGLETWADLLAETAERGVQLRILLADFDPFFAADLHHIAWRAAHTIHDRVGGDTKVLCAPHGQAAGWLWRLFMRGKLKERLNDMRASDPGDLTPVEKAALKGVAHLRPVTLHQKFAVADGARAMIGGLDINERRFDTPRHDRPAKETWHDVAVSVDGPFCATLARHFTECWNRSLPCGETPDGATAHTLPTPKAVPHNAPHLLRTVSMPCPGPSRLGPRPEVREIETATLKAIAAARHSLYIETQFLRHRPVIDALVAAAERPDLNLIMILPPFAERVLFDGDDGWDARHAHALQARGLGRIDTAYGARCALIAPAQPIAVPDDTPAVHGAGPVYVHSKVTLADDHTGIIGSANLNGRSLRWDTEASIQFGDAETVMDLRRRLAKIWLGEDVENFTHAATWRAVADRNAGLKPEDRQGFALPYPLKKVRRFSRLLPILPDDMF